MNFCNALFSITPPPLHWITNLGVIKFFAHHYQLSLSYARTRVLWPHASTITPTLGVVKFTILANPFLVIISIYLFVWSILRSREENSLPFMQQTPRHPRVTYFFYQILFQCRMSNEVHEAKSSLSKRIRLLNVFNDIYWKEKILSSIHFPCLWCTTVVSSRIRRSQKWP